MSESFGKNKNLRAEIDALRRMQARTEFLDEPLLETNDIQHHGSVRLAFNRAAHSRAKSEAKH